MITLMNADRMPLPRFWYLPRGEKAVVVMSGDDHSPGNAPGGTAFAFDRFKALSPAGCNVAEWECVRVDLVRLSRQRRSRTLRRRPTSPRASRSALHPVVASCPTAPMTEAQLSAIFDTQLGAWAAQVHEHPGAGRPAAPTASSGPTGRRTPRSSSRTGSGWTRTTTTTPRRGSARSPGFMNGGGFPMRFADLDGTPIDVYQQNTNMTDEATTAYPMHIDTLLDNAIGPHGYYGAFGMNMHTDNPPPHPGSEAIVAAAQARGVPVISYKQMLDWVDGRDNSTIRGLSWSAGTLTFTTTVGAGANGLQTMLPIAGPVGHAERDLERRIAGPLHGADDQGHPVRGLRRPPRPRSPATYS